MIMSLAGSLPEMPCGPILELKGQRKRFHVPFGLKPLIEEMSMRVLQDQPENIYEYLACFMEARVQMKDDLLSKRESKKTSSVRSPPPEEDLSDFIKTIRKSVDEADHYATVIQTAFRGHMAKKLVKDLRKSKEIDVQNHHATVIQAAFRGHLAREKVKELRQSLESGENDDEEGASEYGADETETEEEDDEYYDDEEYYDSEEEMETEVEISEMEELAEEVEILTVKSPNMSKYTVSKTDMGGQQDGYGEEEEE